MVVLISGKIIILVSWPLEISLACLGFGFSENGVAYAFVSFIWFVSSDVYVPVVSLSQLGMALRQTSLTVLSCGYPFCMRFV